MRHLMDDVVVAIILSFMSINLSSSPPSLLFMYYLLFKHYLSTIIFQPIILSTFLSIYQPIYISIYSTISLLYFIHLSIYIYTAIGVMFCSAFMHVGFSVNIMSVIISLFGKEARLID